MKQKPEIPLMLCLVLSLLIQFIALLSFFETNDWILPAKSRDMQVFAVLIINTAASLLYIIRIAGIGKEAVQIFALFIKASSLLFICMAQGSAGDLDILLLLSFCIEIFVLQNIFFSMLSFLLIFTFTLFTLQPHYSAGILITGISFAHGIKALLFCIFGSSFSMIVRNLNIQYRKKEAEVLRLENAVKRIAETNLAYQNYAAIIEDQAIEHERQRLSREIHDIIGYTLTNVLMLIQAALHTRAGKKKSELLQKAQKHIGESVDEARLALRRLRERDGYAVNACTLYAQLVKTFSEITGIDIFIDFGNAAPYIKAGAEKTIYRFLQEGMTNSFRHGKANKIDISFWHCGGRLTVRMRDDGIGSQSGEMQEGIGIKGMRERLERLGGILKAGSVEGGFLLQAVIPEGEQDE